MRDDAHSQSWAKQIDSRRTDTRNFMRHQAKLTIIFVLAVLLISAVFAPTVSAQATSLTPDELDQLLAPIALYPDSLLSQVTTASTNPQEILDVDAWLQHNPGLRGAVLTAAAEQEGFDPAFIALVTFPDVLHSMAENIDDYSALGEAFMTDQGAVAASIQRLRAQAYKSGALRRNGHQQVVIQQSAGQTIYVIQPANPQVVYVPQYDPAVVYVPYGASTMVTTPRITFGIGIGIGPLLVVNRPWGWSGWGWNWTGRYAYYDHGYWRGWASPYRSPYYFYRPRPITWSNRPGYGGNWRYRPPNYRPPARPIHRPGRGPGNPPNGPRPAPPSKPGTPNRPSPPSAPPARPGAPSDPRPAPPSKPGTPSRPSTPPNGKPSTPSGPSQPSGRPGKPGSPDGSRPSRPTPGGTAPAGPNQPSKPPAQPGKDPIRTGENRPASPRQSKPADPD